MSVGLPDQVACQPYIKLLTPTSSASVAATAVQRKRMVSESENAKKKKRRAKKNMNKMPPSEWNCMYEKCHILDGWVCAELCTVLWGHLVRVSVNVAAHIKREIYRKSRSNNRKFVWCWESTDYHSYSDRVLGFACATAQPMKRAIDRFCTAKAYLMCTDTYIYMRRCAWNGTTQCKKHWAEKCHSDCCWCALKVIENKRLHSDRKEKPKSNSRIDEYARERKRILMMKISRCRRFFCTFGFWIIGTSSNSTYRNL